MSRAWAALGLLAGLVVGLFGLLALLSPVAAQTATILVSTIGQTDSGGTPTTASYGVTFTTGSDAATLTSIEFRIENITSAAVTTVPTVHVYTGTATADFLTLGTEVAELTGPSSLAAGIDNYTFMAPANTTLEASSTYFVIMGAVGTSVKLRYQEISGVLQLDSGGVSGWDVPGSYATAATANTFQFTNNIIRFLIRVNGTVSTTTTNNAMTLVSNATQVSDNSWNTSDNRSQPFTTGAVGATLSSVEIISEDTAGDDVAVSLCTVDGSNHPTSVCTPLTAPSSFAAGTLVFTAPDGTTLAATTTYTLLISSTAAVNLDATSSNNEDDGGVTGWSIADSSDYVASSNVWSSYGTLSLRITIKGTLTTNTAPTLENDISDQTATVGTAFSYQVPDTTFTDADDDTLTYAATLADNSALPAWLSFDAATRTFSGTPTAAETVSVKVTASDASESVSDSFDIVVSAAVPGSGNVLVSNFGGSSHDQLSLASKDLAQSFTTGGNATGYTLTSIDLLLRTSSSTNTPTVKLFRGSATGTEVATLGGPAMLIGDGDHFSPSTFTPASPVTLLGSTTYWVVAEGDTHWIFTSNTDDANPATGWVIDDGYYSRTASSTSSFSQTTTTSLKIRVNGTLGSTTVTNNAPTVATAIPDQTAMSGTAFSYQFPADTFTDADSDTLTYMATKSDDSALPAWLSFAPATRTFSGTPTTAETVSVKVTASDASESVSDTFDIVVSAATVVSGDVLVSNINQPARSGNHGFGNEWAHGFVTGSNSTGYNLTSIELKVTTVFSAGISVSLWSANSIGQPDSQIFDFGNPADILTATGTLSFMAPSNTELLKDTRYFIRIDDITATGTPGSIEGTESIADDTGGAPGWGIDDTNFFKRAGVGNWVTTAGTCCILKFTVNGSAKTGGTNSAPTVATAIPDQTATSGTAFSYQVPDATFADADSDTLTYAATLADDTVLPSWLSFDPATRTFSGTPTAVETVSVKVTASDASESVSDTFDIVVSAAATGICSRTAEVQTALLAATSRTACADVTAADLVAVTSLTVNNYSGTVLDPADFAGLTGLTSLEIDASPQLTTVPDNAFAGLTALTTLDFSFLSSLTTLAEDAFDGLTALETLNLEYTDLTALDADLFDGLTALETLYLNNNSLTTLDADLFDGLTVLETLYLTSNLLTTLNADIFDSLTALETLGLGHNGLTTLDADLFDDLTALRILGLSVNGLTTLDADIFDDLTAMEALALDNNGLTTLDADLFDGLTALETLYLNNNLLTTLDADLFDGLTTLEELYLSSNLLTTMDADLFDGLTALTKLYLNSNLLTTMDADLFDGLTALSDLRLDQNSLGTMDADIFDGLTALTNLALQDNRLTALDADIFDGISLLDRLDLNCNYFTALDLNIFNPFAATLTALNLQSDSFTTPPTDAAIRAKFTNIDTVLTGVTTCDRVTVSPTPLTVTEGASGTLSVALRSQPTGDVTLAISSDNPDVTVAPSTALTFTAANWDTDQTVTVSAAQDTDEADESATLILDPAGNDYDVVNSTVLTVTVTDDDGTAVNNAPTVATEIPDQTATSGTAFSYQVPDTTFADADNDTLTYAATLADDTVLPSWLSFDPATRTFSGTPTAVETVSVKVTASDASESVSDTFDIVVSAALPAIIVEADRATATGKVDFITYTLTREGDTAAALTVTLTFEGPAGNDWGLDSAGSAMRQVTFGAGQETVTQIILLAPGFRNIGFSQSTTEGGTLTARLGAVTGYDTSDTDEVVVVVVDGPAWVIQLSETAYRFTENGGAQTIVVEATAGSAEMPPPSVSTSNMSAVTFVLLTAAGTAVAEATMITGDYVALSSATKNVLASGCSGGAGDALVCRTETTLTLVDDDVAEPDETFDLVLTSAPGIGPAIRYQGPDGMSASVSNAYPVTIRDDDFAVTGVTLTSTPLLLASGSSTADTYGEGERIEFSVAFTRPVTVTGAPTFSFVLGTATKTATYTSGSDSETLLFAYTVTSSDMDTDGISWAANTLALAGGTIAGTGNLEHSAQTALTGHMVDGSRNAANIPPTLANEIPNQTAMVGTAFNYAFLANTFNDADGDTLTYTATLDDDTALPTWLSFNAAMRAFSGTPQAADVGTVSVKVTASDGNGESVSDSFDIVVSVAMDTTAPRVASIVRRIPTRSPTNANSLTWRVTFSETVSNVDAADFAVSGTTATVTAVSGATSTYDVSASGGNLASVDATVTLSIASSHDIEDGASNSLTNTIPTGTNDNSYVVDNTAPSVTISGVPATSTAPFTATFTFSEAVPGFAASDITLTNATASSFTSTSTTVYTALVTPTAAGEVTVDVSANAVRDNAGNVNTAATQASSTYTGTVIPVVMLPTVTLRTQTVPESIGTAMLVVTLDQPAGDPLSVPWYTLSSTAASPGDYTNGAGTLIIPSGVTTATISITIIDDAVEEPTETVLVLLSPGDGYDLGGSGATVYILDDDGDGPAPSGATVDGATVVLTYNEPLDGASTPSSTAFVLRVAGEPVSITEVSVDGSEVTLTLAAPVPAGQTVSLDYTQPMSNPIQDASGNKAQSFTRWYLVTESAITITDPTITVPGAPTALSATAVGNTQINLSWTAPGENGGAPISGYKIESSPDGVANWTELVANTGNANTTYEHTGLTVGTSRHYRVSAINSEGAGDPSNIDDATAIIPTVTLRTQTVLESIGTALLAVTLDQPAGDPLSVPWYTLNDTAESPDDYTNGEGTLIIPSGATNATISITIIDDAVEELTETVLVLLSSGTGYDLGGSGATVSILDDDGDGPAPSGATVDGATVVLTYNEPLDDASTPSPTAFVLRVAGDPVSITGVSVDGSEVTLTLAASVPAGQTVSLDYTQPVSDPIQDASGNKAQSFTRWYLVTEGAITNPVITVPDAPTITIAAGTSPVAEGTPAVFTLSRAGSTTVALTVNVTVSEAGGDMVAASNEGARTVTFLANSTTVTLSIATLSDSVAEAHSVVTATVAADTASPASYSVGAPGSAMVTVRDDDSVITVPDAPTALSASAGGETRINLSWRAPADNGRAPIIGYRIEVSPDGVANWTELVANTGNANTTYEHTGLTVDTSRYYRVSAINSAGVGDPSNIDDATTGVITRRTTGGGGGGGGGGPPPVAVPSDADFDWNVTRDIESLHRDNDLPTDIWSDGATLWVLENSASGGDRVFAYDLRSGERVEEHEFELDSRNRFSHGIWSDGVTIWVADSGQDRLFAYVLESGERLAERDIELAERNRDPRGIWSDGETFYVLDSVKDALFVYDFETGELLAEYPLDKLNKSPRGIWSDGVTIWVSDDGAKRLLAYRIENETLRRYEEEEFTFRSLLKASNGDARGIWSDGDVIYVADEQDDKAYTYNIPDATIAQLASLSLSDIDIGEFSSDRLDYAAFDSRGISVTTVNAKATQAGASVTIKPGDADGDPANGHQVILGTETEITITVASADGSRSKSYVVQVSKLTCLSGLTDNRLSEVTLIGGSVGELEACARSAGVDALYHHRDGVWTVLFLFPDLPEFLNQPFRNRFQEGLPPGESLIASRQSPAVATEGATTAN